MSDSVNDLRRIIIEVSARAQEGHIPSSFSVLNLLWVLYDQVLRFSDSTDPGSPADHFIMSKGHAAVGLYAVLAKKGIISWDVLWSFGSFNSPLGGHPDRNKVDGIEASTGSLGHGFPISVGIALGEKIKGTSSRTYVLVGDGECNEGSIWEAASLAAHHQLENLCCIVDNNHSTDRALLMSDMPSRFRAFGWDAVEVDGHDEDAIYAVLTKTSTRPRAVIANTVKGYGCPVMENNPEWHHKMPSIEQVEALVQGLRSV